MLTFAEGDAPLRRRSLRLAVFMNDLAGDITEIERIARKVMGGTRIISISGLTSAASKAFILSRIQAGTGKTFVVVADSNQELES